MAKDTNINNLKLKIMKTLYYNRYVLFSNTSGKFFISEKEKNKNGIKSRYSEGKKNAIMLKMTDSDVDFVQRGTNKKVYAFLLNGTWQVLDEKSLVFYNE